MTSPAAAGASILDRLRNPMPTDRLVGWVMTLVITALAGLLRFWNLGYPRYIVFDETYYAKDAWALLHFGYEVNWPENYDRVIAAGNTAIPSDSASFIVHPQLGKWLIAAGEAMFGMNSFGWRFMPAVFGTLLVFMVIRLARRLARSTLVGAIAGLLITFDGLSFVMSRTALLDIFQSFFLVAGVAAMLCDRDWFRARLARYLTDRGLTSLGGRYGPLVALRPWRLAAGVLFGCAIGVKWNSAFCLAAMCLLTLWWDLRARQLAGAEDAGWISLASDGFFAFVQQVVVAAGVYLATWASWFATSNGWDRQWGHQHPNSPLVRMFGPDLGALLFYHQEISDFHNGAFIKAATHPYRADPSGWLLMIRTIGIDAVNDITPGTQGCPAGGAPCVQVISGMGTPVLWWMAFAALIAGLGWWIISRDWRHSLPIVAALSTYLPWFAFAERPLFFFYAITIIPFTAINLALALGKLLGPAHERRRRRAGALVVGVAVALVIMNFWFIYPILTDAVQPRWLWQLRMWLPTWV